MSAELVQPLRRAFHKRVKPTKWLRDNLHPMDAEDGDEFIADIESGGSAGKYFRSAIPYAAFLTPEADIYLLPDFLATIVSESSQAVTVLSHYQESGRLVLASLTRDERDAVVSFVHSLIRIDDFAWMKDTLNEFVALVEKEANQSLQPTSPSGRG
jgi:hypothetical protein